MKKQFGVLPTRYARALYEAAKDGDVVVEVERDLIALDSTLTDHPELGAFLLNPGLSEQKLKGLLRSLASRLNLHPVSRKFLDLLLEKRRLELLSTIPTYYHRLYLSHQGEIEVTVTTAIDPSPGIKDRIQTHLAQKSGKQPQITWAVQPAILGGLIVEWPGSIMNGSLVRKLSELKDRMTEAV